MKNKYVIIMKVGPHSNMNLDEIIQSKVEEERIHGRHFWGYSGVFAQPKAVQTFCQKAKEEGEVVKLILIETKSKYESSIGYITEYSPDKTNYFKFDKPVQLQGAEFSFVCKNIKKKTDFCLEDYVVVGGKNDGKPVVEHLVFRVNKCLAKLSKMATTTRHPLKVLEVDLVEPYAIWLK